MIKYVDLYTPFSLTGVWNLLWTFRHIFGAGVAISNVEVHNRMVRNTTWLDGFLQ